MYNEPTQKAALLSVQQVASLMQISTRSVWRLLSSGELIEPVRLRGNTRWRRAELKPGLKRVARRSSQAKDSH